MLICILLIVTGGVNGIGGGSGERRKKEISFVVVAVVNVRRMGTSRKFSTLLSVVSSFSVLSASSHLCFSFPEMVKLSQILSLPAYDCWLPPVIFCIFTS